MTVSASPTSGAWSRWRLLATLATIVVVTVGLLVGLVLTVGQALTPAADADPIPASVGSQDRQSDASIRGEAFRDEVAAEQMLQVPASAAVTPQISTQLAPTMTVPEATSTGPAAVASGFPRTPEGAVAQLAAIDVQVVAAMSIPVAHAVHDGWALPGGATAADWVMTKNVQVFLTGAGDQGNAKDDTVLVIADAVAGQVKGVDGPDWVLACVLLDVRAFIVADSRIGYGHCERMAWSVDRWMIAPGAPPVRAPSTWPGSDLSIGAGWRIFTRD